jgi:hypothetical protein
VLPFDFPVYFSLRVLRDLGVFISKYRFFCLGLKLARIIALGESGILVLLNENLFITFFSFLNLEFD